MLHQAADGDYLPAEDHHRAGPHLTSSSYLMLQTCMGYRCSSSSSSTTTTTPTPKHAKLDFLSKLATSLIFSIILVNFPSWPLASRSQWWTWYSWIILDHRHPAQGAALPLRPTSSDCLQTARTRQIPTGLPPRMSHTWPPMWGSIGPLRTLAVPPRMWGSEAQGQDWRAPRKCCSHP